MDRRFAGALVCSTFLHLIALAVPLHSALPAGAAYPPPLHVVLREIPVAVALPNEPPVTAVAPATGEIPVSVVPATIVDLTASEAPDRAVPERYYPLAELTRRPEPLRDWDEEAWRLPPQAHGKTVVTIFISSRGTVDRVEFGEPERTELHDWIEATLLAGEAFSPGQVSGVNVPTRMTLEIDLTALGR